MSFDQFPLSPPVLAGIAGAGYVAPLPIQKVAIPAVLEGEDVVGCAQTGMGKTAAFLIPLIEMLHDQPKVRRYRPRALVLAPTRELAVQVGEAFAVLASETALRAVVITGGVELGPQEVALGEGADLIVATPGRLREHLQRGGLRFGELQFLVIDEADRLLDAGFLPEVRAIVDTLPERRQTLLFSATMPPEMEQLARTILRHPKRLQIGLVEPKEAIEEEFYPVAEGQKGELFRALVAEQRDLGKLLVFVRTRARAAELTPVLRTLTGLATAQLHGDLLQEERRAALEEFRAGDIRVLVATDVASRGLDIEGVTHIINYDVPNTPEDYIHRVGRTARVDRSGVALTLVSTEERALAERIRAAVRRPIRTGRLAGFPYEFPGEEGATLLSPPPPRKPLSFHERPAGEGKRPSPFTKGGGLKKSFARREEATENQRNRRKRIEKKAKRKLPHKRRKG